MTYRVLFYDPRDPFKQLVETFTGPEADKTAKRWAKMVKKNNWKIDKIERVKE